MSIRESGSWRRHGAERGSRLPGVPLRVLSVAAAVAVGTAAAGGATAPQGEEMLLGAILRGMDVRARLMRESVQSAKGLWRVETWSKSAPAEPDEKGKTAWRYGSRLTKPFAQNMTMRIYCAFAGERYRQVQKVLAPADISWTDAEGYDGREAWRVYADERRPTTRMEIDGLLVEELAAVRPGTTEFIREGGAVLDGAEIVNGYQCYVLAFTQSGARATAAVRHRIWVCPDLGYALVRAVQTYAPEGKPSSRMELSYSEFRQYGKDVWLPLRYESANRSRAPGEKEWVTTSRQQARAEYLKVNIPIPDEEFACPER